MEQLFFEKLTPTNDVDLKGYEDAIDFIFSNNDIRNIAVSGAYSSGKSSVIGTYENIHTDKSFLHLSLAHFIQSENTEDAFSSDQQSIEGATNEKHIEGKILNQLIQQIKPSLIPQTSFRIKRKIDERKILKVSFSICILFLLSVYIIFYNKWSLFVSSLKDSLVKDFFLLSTSPFLRIFSLIIVIAILCRFVYQVVNIQYKKNILKKVSVQGNEIEIFSNENDSFFDKYLNEVLYLFENTQVDAIIFEDIDRFDSIDIFERLREINTLVNIRLADACEMRKGRLKRIITRKAKDVGFEPLRFIYLLRDDIFETKDRTKFFDYILPIVPVLDSSNSYNMLKKYLSSAGIYNKFDDHFLRGVSLYIDDLRVLKNIFNEFLIYNQRLEGIELNINKHLAIIIYKNLFPHDFANLQVNQGFVFTVFQSKDQIIADRKKQLQASIDDIRNKIELCNKEHLLKQEELTIVKNYRERNISSNTQAYKELDKSFSTRKQAIEDKLNGSIEQLEIELRTKEVEMEKLENSRICDLLDKSIIEKVFDTNHINGSKNLDNYHSVKTNPYFGLLKYLISHGYIDETYFDYIGYFYPNSLSRNDKMFLRSITDQIAKPYYYHLDSPTLVLESLSDVDFDQSETLNYDLFEQLLCAKTQNYITRLIRQIIEKQKYDFLEGYISRGRQLDSLSIAICDEYPYAFEMFLNSHALSNAALKTLSYQIVECCNADTLNAINNDNVLTNYISNDYMYLSVEHVNIDSFVKGLQTLDIIFTGFNTKEINQDIFDFVYQNNMYAITQENIQLMLTNMCGVKSVTNLYPSFSSFIIDGIDRNIPLCNYLWNNIELTMDIYLSRFDGSINDSNNIIVLILNNSDLSNGKKEEYISRLSDRVNSISDVTAPEIQTMILSHYRVQYIASNIIYYFKHFGLTDELIEFINSDEHFLNFNEESNPEITQFADACVKCNSLSQIKYTQLITNITEPFDEFTYMDLSNEHLVILIKHGIIPMNSKNLNFIRNAYPDALYIYIKHDIPLYLKLISEEFNLAETKEMLHWTELSDDQKIEMLSYTDKPIKLTNETYKKKLILYILSNNYSSDDLPWLLETYSRHAKEVQDQIYSISINTFNLVIIHGKNMAERIRMRLFQSSEINESQKIELLRITADTMGNEELYEILNTLGGDKIVNNLKGGNQRVGIDARSTELIDALVDAKKIRRPEEEKAGKFYKRIRFERANSSHTISRELL